MFAVKDIRRKRLVKLLLLWLMAGAMALSPALAQETGATVSGGGSEALLPKPQLSLVESRVVAAGVEHATYQGVLPDGEPIMVQVIQADLHNPEVTVKPVAAQEGNYGKRESVASLGARSGAVAAVNGGFFSTAAPYAPIGNLVIDGELQAASDMYRTSLGWLADGSVRFGYFQPQSYLELPGGLRLPVEGINQPEEKGEGIILFTPERGEIVGSLEGIEETGEPGLFAVLVPLEDGSYQVAGLVTGAAAIPAGGLVAALPAEGPGTKELVTGTRVQVRLGQDPSWPGLKHLLTGGPLLVDEGRPVFQYALEGLAGSLATRHPRTAVGVTPEGKMLLVTVDGRQPGVSVGVTFEELAYLMVELGARQAMGLDGGGSTTAWVNGQVVNRVSDGSQRLVANALVVRSGIAVFIDGKRIYFDVPPRLEEGRTLVPLRAFFEALGAKVEWLEETKTVVALKGSRSVELPVGAPAATVNGQEVPLDVPAQVVDGRTLVPLRFVGEALGARVQWDPAKIITVDSPEEVGQ